MMKAIRLHARGGPEQLVFEEAGKAASLGVRALFFIVKPDRPQLSQLRPVVEAIVPPERAREAFERGLQSHNRGELVLSVAQAAAV